MQHVAVLPEHIDFLNPRDGLHVELLQRALELLVVLRRGGLRFLHNLSPNRALSTYRSAIWTNQ